MEFVLIDYSEVYYKTIAKKPMPVKRGGKFIQIINEGNDAEYLAFSPGELSSFHANIVERFCLKGIEGSYTTKKRDRFEIRDPEWIIVGGGMWTISDDERRLDLFDQSKVYGKFDPVGLKKKLLSVETLSGYKIQIDGI